MNDLEKFIEKWIHKHDRSDQLLIEETRLKQEIEKTKQEEAKARQAEANKVEFEYKKMELEYKMSQEKKLECNTQKIKK